MRSESVLEKTQVGIEFIGGAEHYQDKILKFVLEADCLQRSSSGRQITTGDTLGTIRQIFVSLFLP